MLSARREIYRESLGAMLEPVTLFTFGRPDRSDDVRQLAEDLARLSPLLTVRHETAESGQLGPLDLPILSPSGPQSFGPLGARFLGAPDGFLLDLLVDEVIALSRGRELASTLAREALSHVHAPLRARVLGTPG